VAAHQQVGSFQVVNQFGALRKNGGNVASYFCTPDGRVIDAVAGPVGADKLLAEAKWAVDAYEKAGPPSTGQAQALAKEHRQAAEELALSSSGGRGSSQRIHQLLAEHPLPPLNDVYKDIFETILGQRVTPPTTETAQTQLAFDAARRNELPVLLVLYKNGDHAGIERDWNQVLSRDRPDSEQLKSLAACYVVIMMQLDLLPELSQHLGARPFAAPDAGQPLFVVARSNGRQIGAVTTWDNLHNLVGLMAQGLLQEAKERPRDKSQLERLWELLEPIDAGLADQVQRLIKEAGKNRT
jgi:hypothetical protein